ncbi:MAG: hypothetical protein ACXVRS_14615 [Gaiellaceae bacterium]
MPFFCGIVHKHPDGALAKAGWGWPLSRVDVRERDVHAYTPVLFGQWTLDVPYVEIDEAVVRRHRWGGEVVLRRNGGDVILSTMGGNYTRIGNLLREKGLRVTGDQG